ncbi:S8 family serine peptidase [Streptosporangium sp. NPDC051023]|uniref:S8 family serine peptidase n=1 Tax=Streptosporangium sp. NPDC051023 TaxID=3155410 RepID=UPI00345075C3
MTNAQRPAKRRQRAALAVLAALGALAVPVAPSAAGTTAPPSDPVRGQNGGESITLITGDRVTASGKPGAPAYQATPGAGRKVSFLIESRGGQTYVLPSDATPLIDAGLVDERLFNVTRLLEWGYGDARSTRIPVLTKGGAAPGPAVAGVSLRSVGMKAAEVPKAQASTVWQRLRPKPGAKSLAAGVSKLWLDGGVFPSLDRSVAQIGAPQAWAKGLTGKGVTVAVLDTGYDPHHPDLKGVVTQAVNFTDAPDTMDTFNHGTHVASTVAGSGAASGGRYRGAAPDAKIAVGKVLKGQGNNKTSDVIAGMEWAALEIKAPIVNMSLGMRDTPAMDPLEEAVNTLSEQTGSLFLVAAGNEGKKGEETLDSPGSADAALTVGAVDRDESLADTSSRGPRFIDRAVKPDITAPGVGIVAAHSPWSAESPYEAMDGTSMATPHVAGAAAILLQQHPGWNGRQLKAALMASARPNAKLTYYQQGAGRVDVAKAVAQDVVSDTGNLWTYRFWPHNDEPLTRDVTYTNASDRPVEVSLTEDGPYTLSTDRLALPAGGDATVRLTLDSSLPPGDYPGTLTATSGQTVLRTLAGAYVEPEAYNITVTAVGRNGEPEENVVSTLYNPTTGESTPLKFIFGVAHRRLKPGDWILRARLTEKRVGQNPNDVVIVSETLVNRPIRVGPADVRLTLDARLGRQIKFAVDDPAARPGSDLQVEMRNTAGPHSSTDYHFFPAEVPVFVLPSRQEGLTYLAYQVLVSPGAAASRYDLIDLRTGEMPFEPAKRFTRADLTKVAMTFRAQDTGGTARFKRKFELPGGWFLQNYRTPVTLPGTLDNYLTPITGTLWSGELTQAGHTLADLDIRTLPPGQHTETWNAAVTGPGTLRITREGDTLDYLPDDLFNDSDPAHTGWDADITGTMKLLNGDTVLQETDLADCDLVSDCRVSAQVPPAEGVYTITVSARRDAARGLSTEVDSAWTFASAHAAENTRYAVPSIRYVPQGLDDSNRARPGSTTEIAITADGGRLDTLRVEASFDDGGTWQDLRLTRTGTGWSTSVTNPATPGYVTLRATGSGPGFPKVKQTVTRAYAVQN